MREPGFYWVKVKEVPKRWTIAEYEEFANDPDAHWWRVGYGSAYKESDMSEIGPKIEEPKQ